MTDEERRIISGYVERVSGAAQPAPAAASPWGGSVPQTQAAPRQPLPPVDAEADRLIGDLFARYPEARYRITQTAFVQEAALVEAQNRIRRLEWEVENAQREGQAAAAQPRGVFGGMFGGNRGPQPAPMPPPPQPQYPPGYNPQALQPGRSGPGFLGTALMTAAGVAGGLVVGNALMGMFSGGAAQAATGALGAAGAGAGAFAQEAVPTAANSPWTNPTGQDDAAPAGGDQNADAGQTDSWGQQPDAGSDYGADNYGGGADDAGGMDEEY
jgi:hypothetical protein